MKQKRNPKNPLKLSPAQEKQKLHDERKVRGTFRFLECTGGTLKFPYRAYPGPIKTYTFTDGETTETTIGVARHLNKSGRIVEPRLILDPKTQTHIKGKIERIRYTFEVDLGYQEEVGQQEASSLILPDTEE